MDEQKKERLRQNAKKAREAKLAKASKQKKLQNKYMQYFEESSESESSEGSSDSEAMPNNDVLYITPKPYKATKGKRKAEKKKAMKGYGKLSAVDSELQQIRNDMNNMMMAFNTMARKTKKAGRAKKVIVEKRVEPTPPVQQTQSNLDPLVEQILRMNMINTK